MDEATSARVALELIRAGWDARALVGGWQALLDAGHPVTPLVEDAAPA